MLRLRKLACHSQSIVLFTASESIFKLQNRLKILKSERKISSLLEYFLQRANNNAFSRLDFVFFLFAR